MCYDSYHLALDFFHIMICLLHGQVAVFTSDWIYCGARAKEGDLHLSFANFLPDSSLWMLQAPRVKEGWMMQLVLEVPVVPA